MDVGDVLDVGGAGLLVDLKGPVAVAEDSLGAADPRVVVAEDARVLLVSRRIAGDLTKVEAVGGVGGLQQHHAVLGIQPLFHALEGLFRLTGLLADARHDAHALRLDEDLALVAFLAADGLAEGVVGAAEPCTVPAGGQRGLFHLRNGGAGVGGFVREVPVAAQVGVFLAVFDEHTGDENALRHRAFAGAGDLEALARILGEAVQVQAVVPVGAADEGQTVGAEVGAGEVEAAAQMLHQRLSLALIVVKGHGLVEDAVVAGLAQISGGARNQPQRVIVKAGAHVPVALFGQGLVLVVGAAVLKLGGSDIEDAAACAFGDHVHEAQQVLAGIAEAHAAADAALVVAGRAAHVEGDHALILVPQVHHPVQLFVAGVQLQSGQQVVPVGGQRLAGLVHLRVGGVAGHHGLGAGLVDDAGGGELFGHRVLDVAQPEEDGLRLSSFQREVEVVGADGSPAVGHAVGAVPCLDGFGFCRAAVHAAEGVAAGVEAGDRSVGPEHSVVVAALAVLGLVVDGAAHHLHLAGGEVALEVGAVVHGIPQAELHIAEHIQRAGGVRLVLQRQAVDLARIAAGHEQLLLGADAVLLTGQDGVAEAVAAAVGIQFRLGGLPAGVPDRAAVVDVDAVAVHIQRGVVVAVAGDAAQPSIPIKAVAAAGVGHEAEEVLAAQIVDPRQGCARGVDHVFPVCIIKMSEFHKICSSFAENRKRAATIRKAKTIENAPQRERERLRCFKHSRFRAEIQGGL